MRRVLAGIVSACRGRKRHGGCIMVASCEPRARVYLGALVDAWIFRVCSGAGRELPAAREQTRERESQRNSAAHAGVLGSMCWCIADAFCPSIKFTYEEGSVVSEVADADGPGRIRVALTACRQLSIGSQM